MIKSRGFYPLENKNRNMSTPGLRGTPQPQSISNVSQVSASPIKATYAAAALKEKCPTRNQAVVIDFVEGATIREYALAVGEIIGPANMVSISRISQNRVCIYLNSEVNADVLVSSHKYISINGISLEIRPLNSKTKRVLISNVHTSIPNQEIEKLFQKYNVTIKSQITRLKTGLNDVGYTHLLSHRRQVYIDSADINKIPQSCQLEYDEVTYWIYFSSDKLSCFLCKEEGHTAKYCKNTNSAATKLSTIDLSQTSSKQSTGNTNTANINASATPNNNINTSPNNNNTEITHTIDLSTNGRKRPPAPSTITSNASNPEDSQSVPNPTAEKNSATFKLPSKDAKPDAFKSPKKKIKSNSNISVSDILVQLEPAVDFYRLNNLQPDIDFSTVANFLCSAHGQQDLHSVMQDFQFTSDSIGKFLKNIYNHSEKKLKTRITRILRKLELEDLGSSNLDTSAEE